MRLICVHYFFCHKVHKRLHTGDKPYECNFCNRPFRQWGDLKYHIQSRHTKEKSHQCEFCGKDFARRYSLVIHRRIHTGNQTNSRQMNIYSIYTNTNFVHLQVKRTTNVNFVIRNFGQAPIYKYIEKSTQVKY